MEAQILEKLSKLSQEIQDLKNSASTATPVAAGVRQQVVNVNDILKAAEQWRF